jgi:hypothetical protein
VTCEVLAPTGGTKPPSAKRPWWLIAAILGGLLVVGASAWAVWKVVIRKPALGESCKPTKGCQDGLLCMPDVQKCLLAGGVSCKPTQPDQCASGECKSKIEVCAIPLGGACNPGDPNAVFCAKHSACDPATKKCLRDVAACTAGARQCTPDGTGTSTCDDDGNWKSEPCPMNAPWCRDAKCQCAANLNQPCGQCAGKVQCNGSCSVATPSNWGQPCGQCGGKVQCNGSCSVATPPNWGQPCGQCGGRFQCDGTCSIPIPPNLGQPCGQCGGKFQCDGTCSIPTPPNLNQLCGQCGGRFQCDGTCSIPTPPNLNQSCGQCGGRVQCNGSCSVATPPNLNQPCGECGGRVTCAGGCSNTTPRCPVGFVVDPVAPGQCRSRNATPVYNVARSLGASIVGLRLDETINISCGAGRIQSSIDIRKLSGGNGHCEGMWANNNNPSDCSVRFHAGASALTNFVCGITVNSSARRPQCTN